MLHFLFKGVDLQTVKCPGFRM